MVVSFNKSMPTGHRVNLTRMLRLGLKAAIAMPKLIRATLLQVPAFGLYASERMSSPLTSRPLSSTFYPFERTA